MVNLDYINKSHEGSVWEEIKGELSGEHLEE